MGVYVVTGGSGGIGGKTVEILRSQGHETINVDLKGGDINANIATKEGRQDVIDKIYELHPEGIDGLICVAGVAGTCGDMKLMFSLNYFGVTGLAYGIYDLLKKKGGSCVVIVSNTISQGGVHMDLCDMLNYACNQDRNEARILSILEQYDGSNMTMAQGLYATTKYALALSKLFSPTAIFVDHCPRDAGKPLVSTYGPEAIDMFYHNRFLFRHFRITDARIVSDTQAYYYAVYDGYHVRALATITEFSSDGLIERLVVRPA